jgi:spore maturation protein CgeB
VTVSSCTAEHTSRPQAGALVPAGSPIRHLRRLPKLVSPQLCILVVRSAYHVQRECCVALRALGHRVIPLELSEGTDSAHVAAAVDQLLRAVVRHRPDMLVTINYLGFDTGGHMAEIVEALGLPTAIWFVDNPIFAGQGRVRVPPEHTTLFTWDRSFVPLLADATATAVQHLPLATDLDTFACGRTTAPPRWASTFVGSSLAGLQDKWHNRLTAPERELAQRLVPQLRKDRRTMIAQSRLAGPAPDAHARILAYANFIASKDYRLQLLCALSAGDLTVFGDVGWQALLPNATTCGGFDYGPKLAHVYARSAVNFNATNLQMPCTVNQRVFDVPAAGGLLLTDRQPELEDYFVPGQEVLVYDDPVQAADLATYHAAHPKAGQALVSAAQQRIAAHHTYHHRLRQLVTTMRQNHARGRYSASTGPGANATASAPGCGMG